MGHGVSIVGLNEATIRKYVLEQDREDVMPDKRTCKEYTDPFSPKQEKLLQEQAASQSTWGLNC